MTLNGPEPAAHAARRAQLKERLERALLFIPELPQSVYSNDVHYPYRPDSNVRYLSGFEEPAALLLSNHGKDEDGFTLFVQPRDEQSETWTGKRPGIEDAARVYGADYTYPLDQTHDKLVAHLRHVETLYYAYGQTAAVNQHVLEAVQTVNRERPRAGRPPLAIADAAHLLGEMRLRKRPEEIELMRKAASITAAAHVRLMETLAPGQFEYQVQADLDHAFRIAGCAGPAYGTIAAGGANATVLHYTRNEAKLAEGDLLLTDAAGEYGGYCADLTRTIPVGKSYSGPQAALYDLVLEAQQAAIATVRPGASVEEVHKAAVAVLCGGLVDLGLLEGGVDERIEDESYKRFYVHNTSHWLGMDVHDSGAYRIGDKSRPLEPGFVLTVEPGLYVREDAEVDESYRGTGIRIEDDVLVTEDGHEVLTSEAPKARAEIEALRRKKGVKSRLST